MRKLLIACLMLVMSLGMFAQEETNLLTTRATALSRKYLRPSMSKLFIIDGSSTSKAAVERLLAIPDLKFDQNVIKNNVFVLSSIPDDQASRDAKVKAEIEKLITKNKIGNQIMKIWFPNFSKETGYGIDMLESRGQFAATDNDVLRAKASYRQTLLNELGEQLIDRSYAVFYVIKDASYYDKKGKYHEFVKMIPYVYKLNFNEEVRNDFYNNHYMTPTGIDETNFPLLYVMNANSGVSSSPSNIDQTKFEDLMTIIGKKVADFQVKTPVASTNPVRAKIGTKEGVRIDKRYAIMEYRQDNEGKEYAKRIATVRACKVADNNTIATGNTEDLSKFYYVKGRPAHEGMTIVENPDFGISIEAQYNMGAIEGAIGYRLSRIMNSLPGFLFYINIGVANDEDGKPMNVRAHTGKEGKVENVGVMRGGIGFAKELNFARTFVLTPSIGGGVLWPIGAKKIDVKSKTYDSDKSSLDSYYIEGAVKLGYMCTRNIQIFGEAGYTYNILGDEFKYMRDWYAQEKHKDAKDPRKLRIGGGIKIYF